MRSCVKEVGQGAVEKGTSALQVTVHTCIGIKAHMHVPIYTHTYNKHMISNV